MKKVVYEGKTYYEPAKDSQALLHAVNIHSFRYYPKDKIVILSDMCCKRFGYEKIYPNSPDSIVIALTYPGDIDKHYDAYRRVNEGEKNVSLKLRSVNGDYFRVTYAILESDSEGKPEVVAGIVQDFDDHMKAAEITKMLSNDYLSVYGVDLQLDKISPYRISDHVASNFGNIFEERNSYSEAMSRLLEAYVVPEELAEMRRVVSCENIIKKLKEKNVYMHDFRAIIDGNPVYYRFKASSLEEGEEYKIVVGFADVSKEKAIEWKRLAYLDPVTGGYNYTFYTEHLKNEKRPGYIISMDIYSFKIVNSVCGLDKGDFILRSVSEVVASAIRNKGFYGHLNADHFVIYVHTEDEQTVVELLELITEEIHQMVNRFKIPKISPYFGVTKWKPGIRDQVAFSEASTAKHNIKDRKDINYGFYRTEDFDKFLEEKELESAFEEAIDERQFEVWCQPKYSPFDDSLTGAEALVRWKRPNGEMVSPGKFIPIFEKNGMIRELDRYVFTEVCFMQKKWIEEIGVTIPVSVNLSRASLYFENVVDEYKAIADEIGVLPELVPIEITESAAVNNDYIRSLADKFFNAGFPLHIDDFGTGYSSLSTLNTMRFDTLKLDKSLIDYIGNFGGDRLLKHTIALAKDLGLHVTAEGVEDQTQVEFLKNLECDSIQGFYYSRPMPSEFFAQKLTDEKINDKYLYRKGQEFTFPVILEACRRAYNNSLAQEIEGHAAIQINVTGEGNGAFYLEIKNGSLDIQPYEYYDRDALITAPSNILWDVFKGKYTIEQAYKEGKVSVEGDWGIVVLLNQIAIRKG